MAVLGSHPRISWARPVWEAKHPSAWMRAEGIGGVGGHAKKAGGRGEKHLT